MRRNPLATALAVLVFPFLAATAFATDTDSDGLEDALETALGTDPNDADSDDDGWNDYHEVVVTGTSALDDDHDGDTTIDPSDAFPFDPGSGELDGVIARTGTGAPTTMTFAPSGASPRSEFGAYLNSGVLRRSFSIGRSAGITTSTLRPMNSGSDPPLPSSTDETTFDLTFVYLSNSTFNGRSGAGVFSWQLDTAYSVDGSGNFTVLREDGVQVTYVKVGSSYTTPAGMRDTLTESSGIYTRTTPEGLKWTYANGVLDKVEDRFGNTTDLSYTSGAVTSIVDARGKTHTVAYYSGTGRFKSLTTADGAVWYARYNPSGQLLRIEGPTTTTFTSGIWREFRYTNAGSSSPLTGNLIAEIDGRGTTWLRHEYDSSDRLVKHKTGSDAITIDYSQIGSQQTTLTDRAGNEKVWKWNSTTLARSELTEKTNRNVRSGEGDYTTTWTHNSEGYLLTVEHPRGNGVKFTRNSVQLPTEIRRKADMGASDGSGDLVTTLAYDSSKYYGVTSFTDPRGNETTYTLNSKGQPTAVTYETLTQFSPSQTVTLGYTYNADGTMATATDGEGNVTAFDYYTTGSADGLLSAVTVADGDLDLVTALEYTAWGDVSEVTDPRGNATARTVERYGNVTAVDAPSSLGYRTTFEHDGNLNVTKISRKNIDYDGTWLSSPQWIETTVTYTDTNRPLVVTDPIDGSTSRLTTRWWTANDELAAIQQGDLKIEWTRDERDLVWKEVRDPGVGHIAATSYRDYDGNGNLTTFTNPRSKTTTAEFDLFDRRTKTVNALGHYDVLVYDAASNLTERKSYKEDGATDVLMAHHKNYYDEMNRFWKEEDLLQGTTDTWPVRTYTLDKRGLTTERTDRRGYDTTYEYDGAGRLVSVTDAAGDVKEYDLDDNGNVVTLREIEKLHGTSTTETYETDFAYDAINRLTSKTVIDRTNSSNTLVTTWNLDALNFLRRTTDPRGNTTVYLRDRLGRRIEEQVPVATSVTAVTQWTLDWNGNVTRLRDDNGNDTDYEYDDLNRLVQKTYESTATVAYEYDANGNVTETTDQNGTVIAQTFDDLDRLTNRDYTLASGVGGDDTEYFIYDALNRMTEAGDDDSIVKFTYDSLSRVLTEAQGWDPWIVNAKTVSYTWDAEGNLTKITHPSGFEVHRTYAETGMMLTELEDGSSNTIATFQHWHRLDNVQFGNGASTQYTYDGFRRVTGIVHEDSGSTEFAGFDYAYDANGNPLYEARSHQSSGHGDVYAYDKANRLTKTLTDVDDPAAEIASPGTRTYDDKLEYNMDDVHNLSSHVVTPYGGSASTTSYTTNAMNLYTAVGSATPTYDDNGNLIDDDTNLYKFDGRNRLIEVKRKSDNAVLMTAKFDAVGFVGSSVTGMAMDCCPVMMPYAGYGRRFETTASSITTRTIFHGENSIEDYVSGSVARKFVYRDGIDHPVMMEAPDVADVDDDSNTTELKRFYYHTQLIGSVTHITDDADEVVETYTYGPYGETSIKDSDGDPVTASAIGNPWGFTARQFDADVGLYHYRAREYSPELKRFIQRDPLEYADGPNAHAYSHLQPTIRTDPTGLDDDGPKAPPKPGAPLPPLVEDDPGTEGGTDANGGGSPGAEGSDDDGPSVWDIIASIPSFLWRLPTNIVGGCLRVLAGPGESLTKVRDCWFVTDGYDLTIGDFIFLGTGATPAVEQHAEDGHVVQHGMYGPGYLPYAAVSWLGDLLIPDGDSDGWNPFEHEADELAGTNCYGANPALAPGSNSCGC